MRERYEIGHIIGGSEEGGTRREGGGRGVEFRDIKGQILRWREKKGHIIGGGGGEIKRPSLF